MKLAEINQLIKTVDRELWIVTAAIQGKPGGLVATFVSPISIASERPRLAVAISKLHHTWHLIEASSAFAVHLLAESQFDLAWRFGSQTCRDVDKFLGLEWDAGETGSPILRSVSGWLECRVETRFDTGDRTLYLAEVIGGELTGPLTPLTQRQFLTQATPEQLAVLKSQMAVDAKADTAAIDAWRESFRG